MGKCNQVFDYISAFRFLSDLLSHTHKYTVYMILYKFFLYTYSTRRLEFDRFFC